MIFFDFHHHKKSVKFGIYNLNLLEEIPDFPFSVGIHPKDIAENWEKSFDWIKEISKHPNCFAIGECGLDGLIDIEAGLQEKVFEEHIVWANNIKKPVIIHCVRKFNELIPFKKMAKIPMIIHGFNKKKSVAENLLKNHFYFSFGKAVMQNVSLQEFLKNCPLDRFFLESDDVDFDLSELYEKVAEMKNKSIQDIQNQIIKNLEQIKNG